VYLKTQGGKLIDYGQEFTGQATITAGVLNAPKDGKESKGVTGFQKGISGSITISLETGLVTIK
jgi:hypothetical protein